MTSSTSRNQRRSAQTAAQAVAASALANAAQVPEAVMPAIPGDIESYHKLLVQRHAELTSFLQQLQAKAQEVVGQINQVVGEVRAVEAIKAMQGEDGTGRERSSSG